MTSNLLNGKKLSSGAPALNPVSGSAPYDVAPSISAREVWEGLKQPWSSTPQGRLVIRSFSRGVMGAAFYAWGAQKAAKDMVGYNEENPQNALQHMARVIDKVVGKPLIKTLDKIGIDGKEAVSFRPSLSGGARSLGEDAIFNTFDFAMASTGDALGRNIVGLFDPNVKKSWKGEDGKIHLPKAMKSLVGTGGRVLEAQMEDWFVAIPYTFQQKFQRKVINRFSPGFEYAADSTLHGSSFKLDDKGNVVGTYAWEGALDLQGRFTGYNFGTGIYRDLSKAVKGKIHNAFDKEHRDNKKPVHITPASMFNAGKEGVRGGARYLINRAVKTTLVMTPSIPLFSLLRIPQGKHNGIGIKPDGTQMELSEHKGFNSYGDTFNRLDTVLNPFGKAAHKMSAGATKVTTGIAKMRGADEEGIQYAERLADTYMNAAIAYTPYIYAKNEFAHHWDNPDMDKAIYRAIDGVFSGSLKELKSGVGDIRRALKFRDAKEVAADKKRGDGQYHHFSDKVEKKFGKEGSYAESVGRKRDGDWREHLSDRDREAELSPSR